MVLDNLLDLGLNFGGDVTDRDLGEESRLGRGQVRTEFTLPPDDLVNGDRIQLLVGEG